MRAIAEAKNRKFDDDAKSSADDPMSEAEIDRNLVDSFPASDPPSWTLGIDHDAEKLRSSVDEPENKSLEDRPE